MKQVLFGGCMKSSGICLSYSSVYQMGSNFKLDEESFN